MSGDKVDESIRARFGKMFSDMFPHVSELPTTDCPVCGVKLTILDRVPCDLHLGGEKRCPLWKE